MKRWMKWTVAALVLALLAGGEASVLLHLRRGACVGAIDEMGRTPLMVAARKGRSEICGLLIKEGSDLLAVDRDGQPLYSEEFPRERRCLLLGEGRRWRGQDAVDGYLGHAVRIGRTGSVPTPRCSNT